MPITEKYGELKRRRHAAYSARSTLAIFISIFGSMTPACYACACQVDELIERYQAHPPLKSQLFISKTHKRLRDLSDADCGDVQTFLYKGSPVWTGF